MAAIERAVASKKKKKVEERERIDQRKRDREAAKAVRLPQKEETSLKDIFKRTQKKQAIEQGSGVASGVIGSRLTYSSSRLHVRPSTMRMHRSMHGSTPSA